MKSLLIINILLALFLTGCGLKNTAEDTLRFIPGVYITEYKSAYSKTRDTLQINRIPNTHGRQFEIVRRSYHEYHPDRKLPPQYKNERWTASYAERENILLVHNNGRTISFDIKDQFLLMGLKRYKKL